MKTIKFLCILFLFGFESFSQTDFNKYANIQDSLSVKAYEVRDNKKFEKILSDFMLRYNKLPDSTKKQNKNYVSGMYYNLTCLYSLQSNKPSAITNFNNAIKYGYRDYYHILEDTDLDNIRNEEGYKKIVSGLKKTCDYLYILRHAEKYNSSDKREVPKFTYQSANDPNLVALKKAFNLDSIAGTGNEISQILNLLHWIHNLVPHDGSHENPVVKNAMNMIAVCKKDNRGLNCRGMATVLNECYLALGFKSRFLTCLPKDSLGIDDDCHVINMVYSSTHKKWLWIDPTFDAYVMNENGELLSIEEVRDRVINNKPLILNPDANWNHKSSQSKEHYLLNYMAKNMYMFQCPLNSQYDTETAINGKTTEYVQLYPLEYFKQPKEKTVETGKVSKITFVNYPTNNPSIFWQSPE
ncbi:MAG: transglutaminase domain-containing protein [Bacteroidia bacterium]